MARLPRLGHGVACSAAYWSYWGGSSEASLRLKVMDSRSCLLALRSVSSPKLACGQRPASGHEEVRRRPVVAARFLVFVAWLLLGGWVLLMAADQTRLGGLSVASAGVCLLLAAAAGLFREGRASRGFKVVFYAAGSTFIAIGVAVLAAGD